MSGLGLWLCALIGGVIICLGGWAGLKWYGAWAMQRDEAERAKLQAEWKRRAEERKAKTEGQPAPTPEEETGENPPMY